MKKVAAGSVRHLMVAAGCVAVLLVVCGTGCRKGSPQSDGNSPAGGQASSPAGQTSKDTEGPKVDRVMATVNGAEIMESQVSLRVKVNWGPQLEKLAAQSPQMAAQWEETARQMALNQLVIEQLLEEQANQAGISITDEQVMAEMTSQLAGMTPSMTIDEYRQKLESQGGDFDAQKGNFARQMKYDRFLQAKVVADVAVSEDDAKNYYAENPTEFHVPEQVRASHILISTDATEAVADPNQAKAKAREKAETLLKQVKEGADFAAVAKENSTCPSSAQGGDLGLFGRDSMVKPFEDAAFSLKVGEISDVVETEFGYHIIKVTGHQDPNTVMFDAAKDKIMADLKATRMQEAIRSYLASLQEKAQITYPSVPAPAEQPPAPPMASPRS